MKVFYVTFCAGWIGGSAIVVAKSVGGAKKCLKAELKKRDDVGAAHRGNIMSRNIDESIHFHEVDIEKGGISCFKNGDY